MAEFRVHRAKTLQVYERHLASGNVLEILIEDDTGAKHTVVLFEEKDFSADYNVRHIRNTRT